MELSIKRFRILEVFQSPRILEVFQSPKKADKVKNAVQSNHIDFPWPLVCFSENG